MPRRFLITGFGAFGEISNNPSGRILSELHQRLQSDFPRLRIEAAWLPVRPGILDSLPLEGFASIFLLGVDAKAQAIRLETTARNQFKGRPMGDPIPIDPALPASAERQVPPLPKRFSREGLSHGLAFGPGSPGTAGDYVCNDSLFRALGRNRASYFIHLPNRPPADDERLIEVVSELISEIIARII